MKLSAVAALVPARWLVEPAKAIDRSVGGGGAVERTTTIQDSLELSSKALGRLRKANLAAEPSNQNGPISAKEFASKAEVAADGSSDAGAPAKAADGPPSGPTEELTEEQQKQVTELKQRDAEVRSHEQAHVAAGGPYVTGGPTYEYQEGPDGRRYAVGGEVQIDTSPVDGDPEATIQKAQVVRAAALAPAEPSSQDLAVAAAATQMAAQAQAELRDPSRVSDATEGEPSQPPGQSGKPEQPTNGDAAKTQTAATQTFAHQAITRAIAAQLKTTAVSVMDVYG